MGGQTTIIPGSEKRLSLVEVRDRLREALEKNSPGLLRKVLPAAAGYDLVKNYGPYLPFLLRHDGRPYTLADHFFFEPVYQTILADVLTLKTARQLGKTNALGSRGLIGCAVEPYYSTLYITPLFEQCRRFSTQVVRKLIDESYFRDALSGPDTENSVLLRTFRNKAKYTFSFAGLSVDRIRGQSQDHLQVDEAQDVDPPHLPILLETMSASRYGAGTMMVTGTPKTLDTALQGSWDESSQAEWAIRCAACKKHNIPSMHHDLYKMIGPLRKDIGPRRPTKHQLAKGVRPGRPGLVCARCARPVDPREGRWVHRYPDRRLHKPGYHVPQCIAPLHCEEPKRWAKLLAKVAGKGNYTPGKLHNEVFGEAYDIGSKLVTETELKAACRLPWPNDPADLTRAKSRRSEYVLTFLGVDWGGGGESGISFTALAVVGMRVDGRLEVVYGERLLTAHDPVAEAVRIKFVFDEFGCTGLAHDFNGVGAVREVFLVQLGLPQSRITPFFYSRTMAKDIAYPHNPDDTAGRNYWILDKARALQLICGLIRLGNYAFFAWDFEDKDNRGLVCDFLSLAENVVESLRAGKIYTVIGSPTAPDDFAHAVTFASCAMWILRGVWPDLAALAGLRLTPAQARAYGHVFEPDTPLVDQFPAEDRDGPGQVFDYGG